MTEYTREEIHKFVLDRFKPYLGNSDDVDDPFDLQTAINDDAPGRPREAWHMTEFAKVDDLIAEGYEVVEACNRIRRQLPDHVKYSGEDTSFRNIYYEFKREHEIFVRRRAFAYSIVNNNLKEAIEQCCRLSKLTDITKKFDEWI